MQLRTLALPLTTAILLLAATGCPSGSGGSSASPDRLPATPADTNAGTNRPADRVEVDEPGWGSQGTGSEAVASADLGGVDVDELDPSRYLSTVYFEFDRAELGESARETIRQNADWLRSSEGERWSVVIEGHCDERGTIEYNLALGERRANAIRDYMATLGVARDRLRVVSYGEELPAAPGRGEMAWARNRRGEFTAEN